MFTIVRIEIPYQLMLPLNPIVTDEGQPGIPNEFYGLVTYLNDHCPNYIEGFKQRTYRGSWDMQTYVYVAEVALGMMTLPVLEMFRAVGGEIKSLPLFAKINPEENVPGQEVTWQEFFDADPHKTIAQFGEDHYVATTVISEDNDYLPYNQAVTTFGLQNLITQPQYLALQAAAEQAAIEDLGEDEIEGEIVGEGDFPAIEDTP